MRVSFNSSHYPCINNKDVCKSGVATKPSAFLFSINSLGTLFGFSQRRWIEHE